MRILVTGGGGFLGTRIALMLRQRGHQVVVLGRRRYEHLPSSEFEFVVGDICDEQLVAQACRGCDAVIHAAAKTGLAGRWSEFYKTNVLGTRTLIRAAVGQQVARLVYSSSPSVTFHARPQIEVDESIGYSSRWLAHYPRSKAAAEKEVLAANSHALATCALRPHLLWGPGDPHLAPRLWDRARRGKLLHVGNGRNRIDITYVDNAAWAHVLAVESLAPDAPHAGKCYFISDGDPLLCWEWIATILSLQGLKAPERRVSYRVAWYIGWFLECWHRVVAPDCEPLMTRFLAAQLALDHYFDISAARRDLGYQPVVDRAEGLRRWKNFLTKHLDS